DARAPVGRVRNVDEAIGWQLAREVRCGLKYCVPCGQALPEPELHAHWRSPRRMYLHVVVTCARPAVTGWRRSLIFAARHLLTLNRSTWATGPSGPPPAQRARLNVILHRVGASHVQFTPSVAYALLVFHQLLILLAVPAGRPEGARNIDRRALLCLSADDVIPGIRIGNLAFKTI